ncbi:MAG: heavy-metal-associated domain-containing protein [Erysipelotrichaceae bacterium]|nr:heavy-metal-associated domain-containing protein [Erysipelotrichaceae bacterium]
MNKVILKIDGTMCGMCEAHINDVVRKTVSDAQKVSSSSKKGECSFLTENKFDEEVLKKAIADTGYELKGIETEPYVKKKFGFF